MIRKFKTFVVCSSFRDNIWAEDWADMHLISKYNKRIWYLLCVIDIYSKYVWVVLLKDRSGIATTKTFQNLLEESKSKGQKPNKYG